jgi:hypothetical protein
MYLPTTPAITSYADSGLTAVPICTPAWHLSSIHLHNPQLNQRIHTQLHLVRATCNQMPLQQSVPITHSACIPKQLHHVQHDGIRMLHPRMLHPAVTSSGPQGPYLYVSTQYVIITPTHTRRSTPWTWSS